MFGFLKRHRFDLLMQLIKTNFKMRYQNSLLGILWVVIKPYTTFAIMYTIWSSFGGTTIQNYGIYLILGVVFYTYFNELIFFGQASLLDRAGIILKINFPRQIAVLSALVSAVIDLLLNMGLVFIIVLTSKITLTLGGLLYFLFLAVTTFIFAMGTSFFVSIITIRFRDLKNIFELGLFILLWASPVFYLIDSPKLNNISVSLIIGNPIGIVINQVRAAFGIYGEINFPLMLIYFFISVILAFLGWNFFARNVKKVAEFF